MKHKWRDTESLWRCLVGGRLGCRSLLEATVWARHWPDILINSPVHKTDTDCTDTRKSASAFWDFLRISSKFLNMVMKVGKFWFQFGKCFWNWHAWRMVFLNGIMLRESLTFWLVDHFAWFLCKNDRWVRFSYLFSSLDDSCLGIPVLQIEEYEFSWISKKFRLYYSISLWRTIITVLLSCKY